LAGLGPYLGFAGLVLRSRLLGQRRPLLAGYKLTTRCNLRCAHCPFWRKPQAGQDYAGVCATLDRLRDAGVRIVILEGGEPLLWSDNQRTLADLVAYAKRFAWSVGVVTNGTLPLPVEPDVVWVSVDGLEETTKSIRGPIFATQMRRLAESRHARLFANITVSTMNVDEIPQLVETLAPRVRGITIQFFYPYEGEKDLFVPWGKRSALVDRLIAMKRQGYPLLDSVEGLAALRQPGWRCHAWLVASANPDGSTAQGCYLKGRAPIACDQCGFAAHAEMSLAYDLHPGAIMAGMRIFGLLPALRRTA
jgi:Fe-coproporphyrin III synthase